MVNKQLLLVAELEQNKEDKLAQQFGQAQQDLAMQHEKMTGLEKYRFDYMTKMQSTGQTGISSSQLIRFQSFIAQLDKACSQQRENIKKANKVVEQRRALWLQQQRKRKSIELIIDKQKDAALNKANKQEQNMLDEFTLNQLARR